MKIIGRRGFFNKISLGALGTILLSHLPFDLFNGNKNNIPSKINIKLNPNSVRRNK